MTTSREVEDMFKNAKDTLDGTDENAKSAMINDLMDLYTNSIYDEIEYAVKIVGERHAMECKKTNHADCVTRACAAISAFIAIKKAMSIITSRSMASTIPNAGDTDANTRI